MNMDSIVNEIKRLDEYVKVMKKVEGSKAKKMDFDTLLLSIGYLKKWAGIDQPSNQGSNHKKPNIKVNSCNVCDAETETVFNILFKATHICESCASSIFAQQAIWYVTHQKDKKEA